MTRKHCFLTKINLPDKNTCRFSKRNVLVESLKRSKRGLGLPKRALLYIIHINNDMNINIHIDINMNIDITPPPPTPCWGRRRRGRKRGGETGAWAGNRQ